VNRGLPLLLATLLVAGHALAEEPATDYTRSGPFLGLGGTVAIAVELEDDLDKIPTPTDPATSPEVDPSFGLHARAGYRFHPRLAGELHFEWLEDFEIAANGKNQAGVDGWALTLDARGYALTGAIQPFLVVGAGVLRADADDFVSRFGASADGSSFVARMGGGAEIYVTRSVVLDLGITYMLPVGELHDLDYVSIALGLMYRF
jgi:opacity protein-like surface antigen